MLVAQHLLGLETPQQTAPHKGTQDAPTQAGLRLGYGLRSHAGGGVEDDARRAGLHTGLRVRIALARHFIKHPIDCANVEMNMLVQAGAEPVDEGDCADVQGCLVHIGRTRAVGWEVHDSDHSDHAVHLVRRTALAEGIAALAAKPVQHGDNGSTLKATTVLAMLNWLGVKPSYSRPRFSDDNAYAESLFRTAKYRPEFPAKGFIDLEAARTWAAGFVHWYNVEHRHSGIKYVSPAQRHEGQDQNILAARHTLYTQARALNPARWSGKTRNWSPIGPVTLNPERESVVRSNSDHKPIQQLHA